MRRACLALTLNVVVLAACAAPVPMPQVTFTATDYSIAGPDTIPGGLVALHFVTNGTEAHQAQLVRLDDGVSYAKFDSALQVMLASAPKEGDAAFAHLFAVAKPVAGGGPGMDPGHAIDVTLNVPAGNYYLMCFLSGKDGVPHVAKGMMKHLVVSVPSKTQPAAPVAAARVNLMDYAFDSFPALKAGKTTIEVNNKGTEALEMMIVKLKGITAQQFAAIVTTPPAPPTPPAKSKAGRGGAKAAPPAAAPSGPPPFEFVGGMQALEPGGRAWTTVDLAPGDYVAICFVPSYKNAFKAHVALGMMKPFTVSGT